MKILDKVLFAQDFGPSSKNLEKVAIDVAQTFNSKIIPIHVLPDDIVNSKVQSLLYETASSKLKEISEAFRGHDIKVEDPLIKYGTAHEAIVKAAATVNANFILVGSGSEPKDDQFPLGTTTERIIQNSEKPVLVIKENSKLDVKKILCPVDFSEASKRALNNAIIMARRFKAQLIVLSVCELQTPSWFSSKEDIAKENEARFTKHSKAFDVFLKQFNLHDVDWIKENRKGNPAQEILNIISSMNIDLLVMGTNDRTGINRMIMGSVTEKVIREVPCSFLTLKSQDVISLQLETDIKDFETLYQAGEQLEKDGLYDAAIEQFKASLGINTMHVPAYSAIARLFDKIGEPEKAALYRKSANEIKERIWYSKIEEEVRKLRGH